MVTEDSNTGRRRFKLQHWQLISLALMVYDAFSFLLSGFLALWVRFDFRYSHVPERMITAFYIILPYFIVIGIAVYMLFRLYRSVWRFAGLRELYLTFGAVLTAYGVLFVYFRYFNNVMPRSFFLIGFIFQFILTAFSRFAYRFYLLFVSYSSKRSSNVMIIGAGEAGRMIINEITKNRESDDRICCIIDDNPNKWTRYIGKIPIVGGRERILESAKKYAISKIYFAIPNTTRENKADILNICNETGCEVKTLPSLDQLISGKVTLSQMQDVAIEDLLGREPIKADLNEVFNFITGKTILVTGGGGSIGSELCRQIASHQPKQLIIFDIYENNAYDIQLELKDDYPELDLVTLIGSVRDSSRLNQVFNTYDIDIVYHAAAHKHVPLMEDSPCETIKNNVMGTYKTAYEAVRHNVDKFVLISTDKAVNPTNIMGASKRLCEMIIQAFDRKVKDHTFDSVPCLSQHDSYGTYPELNYVTDLVAVRFGNVLGSNGSVVPIFKRQIAKGGPVTVTHPDIIRYFMTISEAVSLVLLAGTHAEGGEIFVLDMGRPVKIDTLARNLIRLSGFVPDKDIKIEYIGLRPGEKLYEEKLMSEEGLQKSPSELIYIGKPIEFDHEGLFESLRSLMKAAYSNSVWIKEMVAEVVGTYKVDKRD